MDQSGEIRSAAFGLLARREYGRRELCRKLERNYPPEAVEAVVDELAAGGYQSDRRYVEALLRNRIAQGYGRRKIEYDLAQKQVPQSLLLEVLDEVDPDWYMLASDAWQRRFGVAPDGDYKAYGKQMRFLLQRGFSSDQAKAAIGSDIE
jgi:regulatory protein